jgi:hypothetical protein
MDILAWAVGLKILWALWDLRSPNPLTRANGQWWLLLLGTGAMLAGAAGLVALPWLHP